MNAKARELMDSINAKRTTMPDRFWAKVQKTDGCWLWIAAVDPNGYGRISRPGRHGGTMLAHRYSAMLHFGMFDCRLQVNHYCDVPGCVRPDHLYLGNQRQNINDMHDRGRDRNGSENQTHCINGHEFTASNTYVWRGYRLCRTCRRHASRRHYVSRRQIAKVI